MALRLVVIAIVGLVLSSFSPLQALSRPTGELPVRGFCIAAPGRESVDRFVKFVDEELASREVNTLVLRVDYNFLYESHPELSQPNGLRQSDIDKLVDVCRSRDINLIPQFNLLGHQSWHTREGLLLRNYPWFDETPWIEMPEAYEWPNEDGLYCKSYCSLHPDVHEVVFALVDELCDAFDATDFHAGMDEVFYIGEDQCPRCGGMNKSKLFADEVARVRDHLAESDRRLWIWGDRLLDGETTGIGMWEASTNDTHRAITMIPKDVMICDWHYEYAVPTSVFFAMHGFDVVTCPWRKADVAVTQLEQTLAFREHSPDPMRGRFQGMMQTVWRGAESFLDQFYSGEQEENETQCFTTLFAAMNEAD